MTARTALYYSDDAYLEGVPRGVRRSGETAGLMGRQVAGKEFLDAYLEHGSWAELVAVVPHARSRRSLQATCEAHPSSRRGPRRLKIVDLAQLRTAFAESPAAEVLHFPCPPDARFAWTRQSLGDSSFAISGVTHTLCSLAAVEALCQFVTAPFESHDRLICTSRAVVEMAGAITDTYAAYLRERQGGDPRRRIQFEQIPLGVDTEKYRPATSGERAEERQRWGIADDEFVVLFVGRLAHHAKAHPFPMYHALAAAARQTQRRLRLLLVGWTPIPAVLEAFRDGAARLAPNITTTVLDGNRADIRWSVWKAADLFTSLADNIQETFGLVIAEAMASGLPVVASDWNGYRDLVVDGDTGLLVRTSMLREATRDLTTQLLLGEINYDHFLARSNQCVTVDSAAAAAAYVRLIQDPETCQRMGRAGRERACQEFSWRRVIASYEALWKCQAEELTEFRASRRHVASPGTGPANYPAPELSFASYPTAWLDEHTAVEAAPDAETRVAELCSLPLTNYEPSQRCHDVAILRKVLQHARAGSSIGKLDEFLRELGVHTLTKQRATVAWLLKYDLLRANR